MELRTTKLLWRCPQERETRSSGATPGAGGVLINARDRSRSPRLFLVLRALEPNAPAATPTFTIPRGTTRFVPFFAARTLRPNASYRLTVAAEGAAPHVITFRAGDAAASPGARPLPPGGFPVGPDLDDDGTPDTTDLCRALPGPPQRKGCPRTFHGSRHDDRIRGTPFPDTISGFGGRDALSGGAGRDRLHGGPDGDVLRGGEDADTVNGNAGNDRLDGGPGDDTLTAGPGSDAVRAGPGDDVIAVKDGERDIVDCGAGGDRVRADRFDRLTGCERRSG